MAEIPDKHKGANQIADVSFSNVDTTARDEADGRKDAMTAQLLHMFEGMNTEIIGYIKTQALITNSMMDSVGKVEAKIDKLMTAFANDDPLSHREYHELLIKIAKDKSEFWNRMRWHLIEAGVFSFLAWAAYQLWKAFLMGPK